MARLLWDASALLKRYYSETGSPAVASLFSLTHPSDTVVTVWAYAESAAILRRRFNEGRLAAADFRNARALLRREVLSSPDVTFVPVEERDVLAGVSLVDRHSINSTDSAILAAFLRYARSVPEACVVVAADRKLLRAAGAEGLSTLNPEQITPADVPTFLSSL
jgi:predicted nucleic acid-binding protein